MQKEKSNLVLQRLLLTGIFPAMLIFCGFAAFAQTPKETMERLQDENRVLSSAIELHLTASDSALQNSTVSLNHEDAWLFFDNVRPADVIANYRTSILVSGQALSNGVNGRVAIYGQGTVIMPFGYNFKALTVFAGDNFGGNSLQLETQLYHNSLGDFDNAIKSFKLKRGYMATFATTADGSGYSRVFIADSKDLEISVMPAELYGNVSFIRVFKHEWVSKKGWCGWNFDDIAKMDVTCYYDWNVGGTTSANYEYSPIRQKAGWPSVSDINAKQNVSHLLGFNEPDRPDQANMTFDQMIDIWPQMMESGLRIGSPAWSNPWGGNGGNLFDFIRKCDELNYRVDFVALHCYWGGKSPQNWYNDLKYIHEQTGRPLWITEWNNGANWTTEWWPNGRGYNDANAQKQLNDMKAILQVLDTASFVERYFIYNWVEDCRAMILPNGSLTLAGEYYKNNPSKIGYNNKKQVVPQWNYSTPELDVQYFTVRNSMRVSWPTDNGELVSEYLLEKKTGEGTFEPVFSTTDATTGFYLDPLDPLSYGTVSYRLKTRTAYGEVLSSKIVSYFQMAGENDIQEGNFEILNLDVNIAYFSRRFSATPLFILGIPTANNPFPMTQRVSGIVKTSGNFFFYPWSYLSGVQLSEPEMLATLALPTGNYDFDGLKAEAKQLANVNGDWMTVAFGQSFDKVPVVFASIVSGANPYPLTLSVRNVNSGGFEIRLKGEETLAAALSGESVNFLAIEPGSGTIDDKRVSVGRNFNGTGISETALVIPLDSSYSEPAVFAALQSENDAFASTLRYSLPGSSEFELRKQRELSGGESDMQEDDFGWMVMDLSHGQSVVETGIAERAQTERLKFYPNPATNTIFFEFGRPRLVEIIDLTGNVLLKSEIIGEMSIASLPAGIYLVKVPGKMPGKLIVKK